MRALLLLAVSSLVLAACSDPKPAEPTPVAEAPATASAPVPEVVNVPPAEVAAKLEGKWQSTQDANSILTITADTWTNTYTGDDTVNDVASWRAFPGTETPPGSEGLTFTPTSTYIEVKSGEHTFIYELGVIDADAFDFFYVSRGNNLSFKRVT